LIDVSDERTGIGLVDQQSLLDQLEDRFSDRPSADTQTGGKLHFHELRARSKTTGEDGVSEDLGDLCSSRPAENQFEFRQLFLHGRPARSSSSCIVASPRCGVGQGERSTAVYLKMPFRQILLH